jgi:hypothetical protein
MLLCTEESIDVWGGSCGGEIWGVIIAVSLRRGLWSSAPSVFSSREEVPAGVSGGECMAEATAAGWVPSEARWNECPDAVREAGAGEAACGLLARTVKQAMPCHTCLLERGQPRQAQRRSSPSYAPGSAMSAARPTDCAALRRPGDSAAPGQRDGWTRSPH